MKKKVKKESLYPHIKIEGNDVRIKDGMNVKYVGIAIFKQEFFYHVKYIERNNNCYTREDAFTSDYPTDIYDEIKSVNIINRKDLDFKKHSCVSRYDFFKSKDITNYHVYLLIDICGIFNSPLVLWSSSYKKEDNVKEVIDLCNNTAKAVMKSRNSKTTLVADIISKFKLKYGKGTIPIRMIDYDFVQKYKLPGFGKNHVYKKNLDILD